MKLFDNTPATADRNDTSPFADFEALNTPQAPPAVSPFADLDEADVDDALESLEMTTVRDVYDRDSLRELGQLLPYEVARDNKAIILEKQNDGTFFIGMCNAQNFINKANVARAMRVPTTALHPRVLLPQRFDKLIEEVYDLTVAQTEGSSTGDSDSREQRTVDWNQFDLNETRIEVNEPQTEIGTGTGLRAQAERIILEAIAQRASDVH